jgi:hypothetical protein
MPNDGSLGADPSGRPSAQKAALLAVRCPCGLEIVGAGEDDLVSAVNAHLDAQHPRVAGSYGAEDILALSYRRPA